jgi:hypothetical protein
MEQRVGHIEKRWVAKCGHVGAVRDQKKAENEKPFGGARKAWWVIFHYVELESPACDESTAAKSERDHI